MGWMIEVEVTASEASGAAEAKTFYGRVMAELIRLDVFDPDFCGEIRRGPVHIGASVADEDFLAATRHGLTAIRTAIHAAGGATPNWPCVDDFEPEPDGEGGWIVHFERSNQAPMLQPA